MEKSVQNILEQVRLLASRFVKEQQDNAKIKLTEEDVKNYQKSKVCYIWRGGLLQKH